MQRVVAATRIASVARMEREADPLEPTVLVSWPCPRCKGTTVQPGTSGQRCTACVRSPRPGWREEQVPLSTLKQLLADN
jgi:hypothetical protein